MSEATGFDAPKWAVKEGHEAEVAARAARWGAWTVRRHECRAADLRAWGWELRGIWEAETGGYRDLGCWFMTLPAPAGAVGVWVPLRAAVVGDYLAFVRTPSERLGAILSAGPGHPELEVELALAALAGHRMTAALRSVLHEPLPPHRRLVSVAWRKP
jgi:hypothetical protein